MPKGQDYKYHDERGENGDGNQHHFITKNISMEGYTHNPEICYICLE